MAALRGATGGATIHCWQTCLLRTWLLLAFSSVAKASEFSVHGEQEPLDVATATPPTAFQWDPKGYVVFCLCMGECVERHALVEHATGVSSVMEAACHGLIFVGFGVC